ncbi:RtcB family protein [bacterium]|nr:RtcB family protein [bacterium]
MQDHRKGAVSAKAGESLIIPINMRDSILICTGKGSAEWNFSAPHGAGRLLSRKDAKELSMDDYRKDMEGVYAPHLSKATLDEAPRAYKSIDYILEHIGDTVSVDKILNPVYNYKEAGKD